MVPPLIVLIRNYIFFYSGIEILSLNVLSSYKKKHLKKIQYKIVSDFFK